MSEDFSKMTPEQLQENVADSPGYKERRKKVEEFFEKEAQPLMDQQRRIPSPSGKYALVVTPYATGPKTWHYSRGQVYTTDGKGTLVADIKRNYGAFPFAFVEGHPDGHDYLVCGEDYQGITVVRLTTGEVKHYFPRSGTKGYGFCWAQISPSPDKKVLAVDGCFWACPYEVVLYDFRKPFELPYPELGRWDDGMEEFGRWNEDGSIELKKEQTVRKSDGKLYDALSNEEQEALLADDAKYDAELEERIFYTIWRPESLKEVK